MMYSWKLIKQPGVCIYESVCSLTRRGVCNCMGIVNMLELLMGRIISFIVRNLVIRIGRKQSCRITGLPLSTRTLLTDDFHPTRRLEKQNTIATKAMTDSQ